MPKSMMSVALGAQAGLEAVDLLEDVGRQASDAVEFGGHVKRLAPRGRPVRLSAMLMSGLDRLRAGVSQAGFGGFSASAAPSAWRGGGGVARSAQRLGEGLGVAGALGGRDVRAGGGAGVWPAKASVSLQRPGVGCGRRDELVAAVAMLGGGARPYWAARPHVGRRSGGMLGEGRDRRASGLDQLAPRRRPPARSGRSWRPERIADAARRAASRTRRRGQQARCHGSACVREKAARARSSASGLMR